MKFAKSLIAIAGVMSIVGPLAPGRPVAAAPPRVESELFQLDLPGDVAFPAGDIERAIVSVNDGLVGVTVLLVGWESPLGPNWEFGQTGLVVEFDIDGDGVSDRDLAIANNAGIVSAVVRTPDLSEVCSSVARYQETATFLSAYFPTSCLRAATGTPLSFRWAASMFYEDVVSGLSSIDSAPNSGWAGPSLETITPTPPPIPPPPPIPIPGPVPVPGPSTRLGPPMVSPSSCESVGAGATGASVDGYTPVDPWRLVDSRPISSTENCSFASFGRLAANGVLAVNVGGRGNIPSGATGVALNVTVTEALAPGYLTVYSCDRPRPTASNLNYRPGVEVANAVFAELSASGTVCVYAMADTHVVIDVNGYFTAPSGFRPLAPDRALDTRGPAGTELVLPAGTITSVPVVGRPGVDPSSGTVVLNVTVDGATARGFVTAFPCGAQRPNASNLNFSSGVAVANAVIAKIGDGGAVCLFNSAPAHLVVDVNGSFSSSSRFAGAVPVRLADSRNGAATVDGISQGGGIHAAGSVRAVQVAGRGGVPLSATSALLNITVTESTGRGFVTVFPCGGVRPTASTSNPQPGTDVANAVFARLTAHGEVCIYTSASTHVIVDLNGSLSV